MDRNKYKWILRQHQIDYLMLQFLYISTHILCDMNLTMVKILLETAV